MRKTSVLTAAIFCFCISGMTAHAADTLLRMHFKRGDQVVYDMKLEVENNIEKDGNLPPAIPQPFKLAATGTVMIEVVAVNDFGVATLRLASSNITTLLNGKNLADAAVMSGMLLKGFELDVDDKSRILEIRLIQPVAGIDVEGLRKLIIAPLMELPEDPVKSGGGWSKDTMADLPYFANMIPFSVEGKLKSVSAVDGKNMATIVTAGTLNQKDISVNLDEVVIPGVDKDKLKITINSVDVKADVSRTLDMGRGTMTAMTLTATANIDATSEMGDDSANISGDISMSLQLTENSTLEK